MLLLALRCDERASSRTYERKLITNAKKVAIGEYIVGERVLVAFE